MCLLPLENPLAKILYALGWDLISPILFDLMAHISNEEGECMKFVDILDATRFLENSSCLFHNFFFSQPFHKKIYVALLDTNLYMQ